MQLTHNTCDQNLSQEENEGGDLVQHNNPEQEAQVRGGLSSGGSLGEIHWKANLYQKVSRKKQTTKCSRQKRSCLGRLFLLLPESKGLKLIEICSKLILSKKPFGTALPESFSNNQWIFCNIMAFFHLHQTDNLSLKFATYIAGKKEKNCSGQDLVHFLANAQDCFANSES